ncbi:MAG: ATP-binding protein [Coriobacteriia bacterium]|nr:ATP-binding protein [Coriobacteriia bacterium]
MRTLINISDVTSVLAYLCALVFVVLIPVPKGQPILRSVRFTLAAAMGLYMFVGLSNVLEWTGVTAMFDPYEDFAELLFLPLMAYTVYTLSLGRQIDVQARAEDAVRTEHRLLTTIVGTTPTGIIVVTPAGLITFANEPARDLLRICEDPATCALVPASGVRIGGQRPDWADPTEAFSDMCSGAPLRDAVRFLMAPDGSTVAVSTSTNPIGEETSGVVIALADVTERMRYRQDLERTVSERTEELVDLNAQLEKANRAKRDFLAKMSHELRTPLNAVIGFTGILIDGMAGPVSEEQGRQLGMVRRAGRQLLDIVNDVLDIARIESGKAAVSDEQVDLCAFGDSMLDTMRPYADDRSIELVVECETEVAVRTDPGKLAQITRNLISNAVKFTDPGGRVSVRIAVRGDVLEIAVVDTGIGMAPAELDRIFEPFSQIDTASRMKPQGTGLGLAVSRDLTELLDGHIGVESSLGAGSTFTVRIPVKQI